MTTGSMGRFVARFVAVLGLAGLTVACASPQHGATVAPAGYGKDDLSRAERLVQYCDRLVDKGELVTALGLCARAHEIDPDNPDTLMKVAGILRSLERPEAAAQTYGLLLELHPRHQEARYSLGKLYMETGEHSLAAMHFNHAMRENPEDPRPYNALGILRDQEGEHEAAQALYRSALERDPNNFSVRNNLGLSLALNGRREEAIELLAELAVDPEADQTVLRNLEVAYATGATPASDGDMAGSSPAPEAAPALAAPAATLPAGSDPVEVKLLDNPPHRPSPVPPKSPAVTAPTVEVPVPNSDGPTPLYPPKPSAMRELQPEGAPARSMSASRRVAPDRGEDDQRPRDAVADAPASVILAAAELLMQPPAQADVEPDALITEVLPQEAATEPSPASPGDAAQPDAAKVDATPQPDTARFKSLSTGSVFSNI